MLEVISKSYFAEINLMSDMNKLYGIKEVAVDKCPKVFIPPKFTDIILHYSKFLKNELIRRYFLKIFTTEIEKLCFKSSTAILPLRFET